MTRQRWIAAGVATVALAAGGMAVILLRDTGEPAATCVTPPAKVTGAPTAGSDGLRVVEKGFSLIDGTTLQTVSVGAIVENISDRVAYRSRITFRVLDSAGQSALEPPSGTQFVLEIPVILPGQRIPVGSWAYVRTAVAQLEVDFGAAQWVPKTDAFAEMTFRVGAISRNSSPESGAVVYSMISPFCRSLTPRGAAMVFRDGGGAIVGGSFEAGGERCDPGEGSGRAFAHGSIPPRIDDSKTQVMVLCDFERAAPKTGDGPFN